MSTFTAILEPSPDGSLHLPLPEELRHGKVRVVAELSAASDSQPEPAEEKQGRKAGSLKRQTGREIWMAPDFDAPLDDFKEYM